MTPERRADIHAFHLAGLLVRTGLPESARRRVRWELALAFAGVVPVADLPADYAETCQEWAALDAERTRQGRLSVSDDALRKALMVRAVAMGARKRRAR
jgi:hypothetical protein